MRPMSLKVFSALTLKLDSRLDPRSLCVPDDLQGYIWTCDDGFDDVCNHEVCLYMLTKNKKSKLAELSALFGNLGMLKYAYENGYTWNTWVLIQAARGGSIQCLEYAYDRGCRLNELATTAAAENGHLACLRFLREKRCPWDRWIPEKASENGHAKCLEYAIVNGCDVSPFVMQTAAINGRLECLRVGHVHSIPMGPEISRDAALSGHLDCLMFLCEAGYPVNTSSILSYEYLRKDIRAYLEAL